MVISTFLMIMDDFPIRNFDISASWAPMIDIRISTSLTLARVFTRLAFAAKLRVVLDSSKCLCDGAIVHMIDVLA